MSNHTPLDMADAARYLKREIINSTAHMIQRELIQNGIESIEPGKSGRIDCMGLRVNGALKLAIQDNGRGMGESDLHNLATKMSWSGAGKDLADDGNFGIGARLIGMKASPGGMLYYSKVAGDPNVRKVMIAMNDDDVPVCIQEPVVTDDCPVDLGEHGTLVILMGRHVNADSFREPWPGAPKRRSAVTRALTERYFRMPSNVAVYFTHHFAERFGQRPDQRFHTLHENLQRFDRYEVVNHGDYRIHFAFAETLPHAEFTQRVHVGHRGGIVWGGEVIDFHSDSTRPSWELESAQVGLEAVYDKMTVFVELKKNPAEYLPASDRTRMYWRHPQIFRNGYSDRTKEVRLRNFSSEIKEAMPQWVKDMIAAASSRRYDKDAQETKQVQLDLFRRFGLLKEVARKDPEGEQIGGEGEAFNGEHGKGDKKRKSNKAKPRVPTGTSTPAKPNIGMDNLPEVVLRDFDKAKQAAMVTADTATGAYVIHLNTAHWLVAKFKGEMQAEFGRVFAESFEDEWVHCATLAAQETLTAHLCAAELVAKEVPNLKAAELVTDDLGGLVIGHALSFMTETRRKLNEQKKRIVRAA